MSITTKAMVLNLNIGLWQGYRLDKEASRKVTDEANADGDAARVNKHLIPKSSLQPIQAAASAIRTHFYDRTMPWKDNGDRLLTRAMYMDFIQTHEDLAAQFDTAVDKFLKRDYLAAVDQASFRMGNLFDPGDYPRVEDLRRKFYVNLDIDVVTEADDFRVQMDQAEINDIRKQMEQALEQRIARAMQDVWGRLLDVVEKFRVKMADTDAIFRNSLISNMEELVELLPGMNVLDDPDLESMRLAVKTKLAGLDPEVLRKDDNLRSTAAREAAEIMDSMRGFMNAYGNVQ
jgi:hypothetical protein